jgi:hypothetical protein
MVRVMEAVLRQQPCLEIVKDLLIRHGTLLSPPPPWGVRKKRGLDL